MYTKDIQSDDPKAPDGKTREEKIEYIDEKIGQRVDPEAIALAALKAWQASQGIEYDPEAPLPPDLLAKMQQDKDEEFMGDFMGPNGQKLRRGKGNELKGDKLG
jgi:hypothetical protein